MKNFKAQTLKEAYRVCDLKPLSGDKLEKYYVDLSNIRRTEAINKVVEKLNFLESGETETILFTGHRGCGKSTELKRIQRKLEKDFWVIYLESNEEIDINDAKYTDFYLVIIKQIEAALRKNDLKFDAELLKNFEEWFMEITQETEEAVEKAVSIESEAKAGFEIPLITKLSTKLLAQIKGSNTQKKTIRETMEKNISRLKTDINRLLKDGLNKLREKCPEYKGFLLIFDNLDRIPPHIGEHLFFDYPKQLQELECSIIYTVPISVVYSKKNLNNVFGEYNIMPMVDIYKYKSDRDELEHNPNALTEVAGLIEKRVSVEDVFESYDLVEKMAEFSGGHVRQLMQLMRNAAITAASRGHDKIKVEDVQYAINQEQFNFERLIPDNHYPILAEVYKEKDVPKDDIGQDMLFNTSVLEYNGDNRWNYINPLVRNIDAFKEAIRKQ